MGLIYMEQIRGYPYMTIGKLADEFHCSVRTVGRRILGIQEEIKKGRYSPYSILEGDGHPLINTYVFMDYQKYQKPLKDRNARKYVPEFNPQELAKICGYCQREVMIEEDKP